MIDPAAATPERGAAVSQPLICRRLALAAAFPLEPSPVSNPTRSPLTADVMTADPRTCSDYSSVLEAALSFRNADCGAVPVVDGGKPVGILTERDVALAKNDDLARVIERLDRIPASGGDEDHPRWCRGPERVGFVPDAHPHHREQAIHDI